MIPSAETELCAYCPAPAVLIYTSSVTRRSDQTGFEAATRGEVPIRGRVTINAPACEKHKDGIGDALLEFFGGTMGEPVGSPAHLDCPDPFHSSEDKSAWAEDVGQVGDWNMIGFRCPTCGFQTIVSADTVEDDAFHFVVNAISSINGASKER